MNFLLGASLIILLLFPGLVFRLAYLNSPYGRGFSFSLVEELVISLIPTLLIHLFCLPFTSLFHLQFDKLYLIIISDETASVAVSRIAVQGYLWYCLFTYAVAGLFGYLTQRIAMHFNWDLNIPLFRIHNEWYYHLRGMLVESKTTGAREFVEVDNIQLDAIVEIGGSAYLYSGIINNFVLSKGDGIDRIFLADAIRKRLVQDKVLNTSTEKILTKEEMKILLDNIESESVIGRNVPRQLSDLIEGQDGYFIPGTTFCLLFNEIKNLNLTYFIAHNPEDLDSV